MDELSVDQGRVHEHRQIKMHNAVTHGYNKLWGEPWLDPQYYCMLASRRKKASIPR
jgi:hypothetical protein